MIPTFHLFHLIHLCCCCLLMHKDISDLTFRLEVHQYKLMQENMYYVRMYCMSLCAYVHTNYSMHFSLLLLLLLLVLLLLCYLYLLPGHAAAVITVFVVVISTFSSYRDVCVWVCTRPIRGPQILLQNKFFNISHDYDGIAVLSSHHFAHQLTSQAAQSSDMH